MNFDYDAYEKTLRATMELLDTMHAQMNIGAFGAFEADIHWAIAETYNKEVSQVRCDMEDLDWMLSGTEDQKTTEYQDMKAQLREDAINWQIWASENDCSYMDLWRTQQWFEKMGRRYGLLKEFKENGII